MKRLSSPKKQKVRALRMNDMFYFMNRNFKFSDIFSSLDEFKQEYQACRLPLGTYFGSVTSDQVKLLYYLLYAKYGNSTIAGSDPEKWKYRLFAKVFQFGPTWIKRIELQKSIRELDLDALQTGGKVIYNHANNPSTEPSTSTLEELEYIDDQNTSNYRKSEIEAYGLQWAMLNDDVTGDFLAQFRKLFLTIVAPDVPLYYNEGGNYEWERSGN